MAASLIPQGNNLGAIIARHVDSNQPWLIEVDPHEQTRIFSYADLHRLAAEVGRSLQDRGLKPGARVGLIGKNSAEYLLTYYGIMQAGYCAVPIGYKLANDTIQHILNDAKVELVYADAFMRSHLPTGLPVLALDNQQQWQAQLSQAGFQIYSPLPGDAATILYTSGSTGVPKGVPLTHGGYIWTLDQVRVNGGQFMYDTAARVLTGAPLSHMNALFLAKTVTAYGASLVLMKQFNAAAFLRACARHSCSIVTAVPTMLALAANEESTLKALDLSHVEVVAIGSAPVTQALFEQIGKMFPKAMVQNGWGTTETGPAVFGPHPQGLTRPLLSIGYPLPDVQLHLEGSDNEGELYVRSQAVMPGYLNRDDATAERLQDGWYRTGDVMRRDVQGFYYFVGRADDMFVCGGENMYPGEIELLLEKHPDIAQAAVVPVPDTIKGQVPAAFIVLKPGAHLDEHGVKQFALQNGPAYQHPRFVRFIPEMPLSAANKIDKKQIAAMAQGLHR